ncbi:MAG: hypothetical protein JWM74_3951 [Myxococcaceae bacterium]|nr:hypothetical protein [Myxococcaceae bacterium]
MSTLRHAGRALLVAVTALAAACSDDPVASSPVVPPTGPCDPANSVATEGTSCIEVGWRACPAGFTADPGAWGCNEVLPADACPVGTMPVLGNTTCQPVGTPACGAGFAADPSGWGCRAVLPAADCTGATYEKLGSTTCTPIGNCAAAFPPAGATLFVDDDFTAGQLDATHFSSIASAVAAAPFGAKIAIDSGTYAAPLLFTRGVELVGRCAEKVIVQGSADGKRGLATSGTRGIVVSGVTVRGFELGVSAEKAGAIDLSNVLVEANRKVGLFAADKDSIIKIRSSSVRGNLPDASDRFGHGASVGYDGLVDATDTAFIANGEAGLYLQRSGHAKITGVVVRSSKTRNAGAAVGPFGYAAGILSGGTLEAHGSAFERSRAAAIALTEKNSSLTFEGGTIDGVTFGVDTVNKPIGVGISITAGAKATFTGTTISRCAEDAAYADSAGELTMTSSVVQEGGAPDGADAAVHIQLGGVAVIKSTAIVNNRGFGITSQSAPSTVTLTDVVVSDTHPTSVSATGYGIELARGGKVTGTRVAVLRNAGVGVVAFDPNSLGTLESSVIDDTRAAPIAEIADNDVLGIGAHANGGGALSLVSSVVRRNAAAGVFAAGTGSNVTLKTTVVRDTLPAGDGSAGFGVIAEEGASLTMEDSGVIASRRSALHVTDPGTVVKASRSVFRATLPDDAGTRGRGVSVQFGAHVDLDHVAIADNRQVGIFLFGKNTQATFTESLLTNTGTDGDGRFGHAVEGIDSSRFIATRSVFSHSKGAALAFATAGGSILASRIEANLIGVHFQDGTNVRVEATVPELAPPLDVIVSSDTTFIDNVSRTSGDVLPLPEPVGKDRK